MNAIKYKLVISCLFYNAVQCLSPKHCHKTNNLYSCGSTECVLQILQISENEEFAQNFDKLEHKSLLC